MNCKHNDWGNISSNTKGNKLKEFLSDYEIMFRCSLYASVSPSYPHCNSFLDIYKHSINCIKTLDYDSDHIAPQIVVLGVANDNAMELYK